MPSIASRLRADLPPGVSGAHVSLAPTSPSLPPLVPTKSYGVRSPLPNLVVTSSDSLRQYYTGGQVPQYRFPPLRPIGPSRTP